MTRGLTDKQERILNFIVDYVDDKGYPPSIREIGTSFEISSLRGVTVHLDALERKGYIEMLPGASRGIRLRESLGLPVIGRVAAGNPILAEQHIQARYQLDPALFKRPAS